jgi:hypothetical protein
MPATASDRSAGLIAAGGIIAPSHSTLHWFHFVWCDWWRFYFQTFHGGYFPGHL